MVKAAAQEKARPMGRPKLDHKPTTVRFPAKLLERIDALVGEKQRAIFIREAVEARVNYAEQLKKMTEPKAQSIPFTPPQK